VTEAQSVYVVPKPKGGQSNSRSSVPTCAGYFYLYRSVYNGSEIRSAFNSKGAEILVRGRLA